MVPDIDIVRIRRGWAAATVVAEETAAIFYAHLFRIDPGTRAMFRGSLEDQGRKLMETLDLVVASLDESDTLLATAGDLARRHLAYGVAPEHYRSVGAALLATLSEMLGDAFTPEDGAAWERAYTALADAMIDAAYP